MIKKTINTIIVPIFAYFIGIAAVTAEDIAVILFTKGTVLLNNKTRLKMGDKIGDSDLVSTKAKSSCEIQVMKSQSPIVIRMKEDSEFSLSKDLNSNTLNSIVRSGKVLFNVEKLKSGDKMNVITPTSVAGVRGTRFEVVVDPIGIHKTLTLEGEVASRPRIPELESIDPQVLKNNQALGKAVQTVSTKNVSVKTGTYVTLSQNGAQEWMKNSGISGAIQSSEDSEAKEKLDTLFKDKDFAKKFDDLANKGVQVYLGKIESEINEKRLETFDELLPVGLSNVHKEKEFLETLADRNKERQYIMLINSLRRDLRYAQAKNLEYESTLNSINTERTTEKKNYEGTIQKLDTSVNQLQKKVSESKEVTEKDKQIQKDIAKHLETLKEIEETLKKITEKVGK